MTPFPWQHKTHNEWGNPDIWRLTEEIQMKNFSKQHMFFLSGRKFAELATMEFLRGLGRERFAPTAASHNCPKVVFQMVFPIWFKDWLNIILKLMWCFQVYLKVLSAYTEPKRFEKAPHEASPSCETRWIPVGTYGATMSNHPFCLGHLHRLHLLRRWR